MMERNNIASHASNLICDEIIHAYPCTRFENVEDCLLRTPIFASVVIFICILGLIGNGIVFWLLGFRIKRNFFSIYVWNLAIADFGVLTAVCSLFICVWSSPSSNPLKLASETYRYLIYLFFFVQCSSIHFLTAISVDRCLVILFPIWHRCHRPKSLSTIVSFALWGISCVFLGLLIFFNCWTGTNPTVIIFFVLFFSVMVISTTILFFKICCNPRLRQCGKAHVAILFSLLFFIITTMLITLFVKHGGKLSSVTLVFLCMNSSVNPVIYFVAGRYQPSGHPRTAIKDVLRWFIKVAEDSGSEVHSADLSLALRAASYENKPPGSGSSTETLPSRVSGGGISCYLIPE